MVRLSHPASCGCQTGDRRASYGVARRDFLRAAASAIALGPAGAWAQSKPGYRAMLLSCVDPRTQAPVADWMDQPEPGSHTIGLRGLYSQFSIAGASVAIAAPRFEAWRGTFWDNLGASIQLHGVRNLICVDHSDCGAVGIAYGQRALDDPMLELSAHRADAKRLADELAVRHPDVDLQAWYVSRDDQKAFTHWQALVGGPVIS